MKSKSLKSSETLFAFAVLLLLVLTAFWKLTSMQGYIITDDIFTSDIMNEGFPYRFSLSQSVQSGHLPLWIPEIYGGFPLLARAEAGIVYPINLILFGLLSPWTALNIVILLTIFTAAVSMYLFVREIGADFIPALMSGVAFAFSGYLLSHLKHLSNVNAACWLPLGLFLIERSIKRKNHKYLFGLSAVFGIQHLSGHTQIAYYSGVTYILYFIFRYLNYQKEENKVNSIAGRLKILFSNKFSLIFILVLAIGSLIAAVQLIPTYELVSLSQRSGGVTFEYASNYAYSPKNLGMFIYPYINGDIGDGTYTGNSIFWEDYGYVGLLTLLFALHAIFRMWKNWHVRWFTIATIVSIVFVLGPSTPIYEFAFNYIPGMKYFRFPTRFLLITDLSLIVLAGLGFTDFVKRFIKQNGKQSNKINPAEIGLFVLVILDLLYFQLRQNPIVDGKKWLEPPKSVQYIKSDSSVFRIFSLGGNEAHIQTFQQSRGWEGDLQPFVDQREFIQPSSNVLYGLSSPNGYANLTPNYIVDIWGDQNRKGILNQTATIRDNKFYPSYVFWRLMDMYNVKYITSLWEISPQKGVELIGKFGEAYLYRNSNFLPRAYLVGKGIVAENNNQSLRILFSNEFNPIEQAVISEIPDGFKSVDSINGNVALTGYTPNEVGFNVTVDKEALLIFSDSYYPGWKAEIDGKESKIIRANVTQRAAVIPAGNHIVKFTFEPKTVATGFWLTITGCLIMVGLVFMPFGKNKNIKQQEKI
ncbi:MAG: YfhO family protein [Ignavibacteriales bacterium]|nr:YfhO family protein [Ignavibacteriales bacterium]